MATTAHAASNLEVAAADMMDLQSDSGLDFDDGDIELDIDPATPTARQDDDVSIEDAAEDSGIHSQTVTADHDDFMIDHEDYGEYNMQSDGEDGEQNVAPPAQASATHERTYTPAPPDDDDLIDYSDEEDDPTPIVAADTKAQTPGSTSSTAIEKQPDHVSEPAVGAYGGSDPEPHYKNVLVADNQVDEQTHGEETGVQLQDPVPEVEADPNDEQHDCPEEQHDIPEEQHDIPEEQYDSPEEQHDIPEEQRSIESRAITINYEGNELWLFKQHDTEDSGDWLIDDISVIHSSLSDLFQACRASLGENISNETELGLRFDHLHNMELFEDNTACVAVSLARLADLYYTLHAQDGESDPESFYMCLLSRPRFATLLSDVAKHAEQGSGYSGLDTAVAAGDTHFAQALSGNSTEHEGPEWDNDEGAYNEEQHEDADLASNEEHEFELTEHEDQDAVQLGGDEKANFEETAGTKTTAHNNALTPRSVAQSILESHSSDSATQNHAEDGLVSTQPDILDLASQQISQLAKTEREVQLANDTVDFSDDEEEEEAPQGRTISAASPSSATVQGDNPTTGKAFVQIAESTAGEDVGHEDATIGAHNDVFDGLAENQEQFELDDNTESYQDYNDIYDQEDPFQDFQLDGQDANQAEVDFNGLTNQDYPGFDYQDVDQQLEDDFISGANIDGLDAGECANIVTDFVDGDDFLDLDNATEWATDQEPASTVPDDTILVHDEVTAENEEEEDGVVKQPAVAASSAADPVAASSTDVQETSPQGQKRSIDEVGDSVGDALDLTDMKRPRM
ncbi:hypothetical protein BDU57DRAFT_540580 [Ampelomyces quisqualis]|uniref:Uncharacterized protein n=1 Tax=Ampelomyces quisqualis TaxID=50730 RepID=A0A6A5QGJ7_AMPQU|nr:hypothetical protein BDU57DRAFT_540580 [Ampelomyces quisqualis]